MRRKSGNIDLLKQSSFLFFNLQVNKPHYPHIIEGQKDLYLYVLK